MKRRLITGVFIVMIIVLVVAAVNIFSDGGNAQVVEFETNEYTGKINRKIDSMQSLKWDVHKTVYKSVVFQIDNYENSSLITEGAANGLSQLLNTTYIRQLKDTSYNYCVKARNKNGWNDIKEELLIYNQSHKELVSEPIVWMDNYMRAYKSIFSAIWYARNRERSEERHLLYTQRFEDYNQLPVSQNRWLFSSTNSKVNQAKSDLINQLRVAERYMEWEEQFLPLADTAGYYLMKSMEATQKEKSIRDWQNTCNCKELKSLIDNQFYNTQCDSLKNLADMQIALIHSILKK